MSRRRLPALVPVLALVASIVTLDCGRSGASPPPEALADIRAADSADLVRMLAASDTGLGVRAARAMGRIQSPAYTAPLAAAAANGPSELRVAALFALGQLGLLQGGDPLPAAAASAARAAMEDDDPRIVAVAAEALGKLAPSGASEPLALLLTHAAAEVREAAAFALFRLRFAPLWRGDVDEAPSLDDHAVAALVQAMADAEPQVRRAAVYAFARYPQPGTAAALARRLGDTDEWVRLFAARGLGLAGDRKHATAVAQLLDDTSPRVRTEAVATLDRLGSIDRCPSGVAADPSIHVRAALARGLGGSGDPRAAELLRELEADPSTLVKTAAIDARAENLGQAYAARLRTLAGDEDWRLRAAAYGATVHLDVVDPALMGTAATDLDVRVRAAALTALAERPGAAARLEAALGDDDLALRGTAVSLLASGDHPRKLELLIGTHADSPGIAWIEVRESIVDALAELDTGEAALREIRAGDPAASVRRRAAAALRRLGETTETTATDAVGVPTRLLDTAFDTDPIVELRTRRGTLRIRCLATEAPVHVAAFVERVTSGFYDGLIWHRVVSNFVIQGGDPRGDGWGGTDEVLRDEIGRSRYERGSVGMPKAGKDTGSCQIFITHVPTPHLDGNYTLFGRVVSGLDVIDRIDIGDRILEARVVSDDE